MSSAHVGVILRHIRTLAVRRPEEGVPDHLLLERFVAGQDEGAYALLLRRHGPMVLAVCRGVLHHEQDAEDAFQAAFLTLARKAGSIQRRESVSSWLYRVAYHVAVKAQANAARRRAHEQKAEAMPSADPLLDMSVRELRGILLEELERLPEKYRAPLVLCYLEEKTQEDAARVLGWTKGAVKGRLERGRQRLRAQLLRRGLALPVGLPALALGPAVASAKVGAGLADAVLKAAPLVAAGQEAATGTISAGAAALLKEVTRSMFAGKLKIATGILLALSTLAAGVGLVGYQQLAAKAEAGRAAADRPRAAKTDQPASGRADETVTIRGRVLGPDGKPFAGARLYVTRSYYDSKDVRFPVRATTGADGRFRFTFAKKELDQKGLDEPFAASVVALAKGYGADWAWAKDPRAGPTLRLTRETSIRGRMLDQDGRPVAGARVHVVSILRYPTPLLSRYLEHIRNAVMEGGEDVAPIRGWPGQLPTQPNPLVTGRDGRFRVTGLGPDDVVSFDVEGPGIHYAGNVQAMTRPSKPVAWPGQDQGLKLYGATFDYLASPARAIRGTVRDKETGKPVAGARISSYGTTHRTETDREGRYELLGCAKASSYTVEVGPPAGAPYFSADVRFTDSAGLAPLTGDISLIRGIPCCGRVTDKQTGKPIASARVEYNALFPNRHILRLGSQVAIPCGSATTDKDGAYCLAVLPGPGALAVTAYRSRDPYMPATLDPKELAALFNDGANHGDENFLTTAAGPNSMGGMGVSNANALFLLNPTESSKAVSRDAVLESGRTLAGRVVGPDGLAVRGVRVYGLEESQGADQTLADATFTVRQLNPRRTRPLLFYHKGKQLGRYQVIRGDETTPLLVKLEPCGSITGRIVDSDGQPIAKAIVHVYRDRLLGPGGGQARTDQDGRFRVDGLVPGQVYEARHAINPALKQPYFGSFTVKPGAVKDLGESKAERDE
ncbi:MAG TPA: sigma-70 family RNA polymerase sigma factor [Gemmataceae bacterium]|jgi:RNA polymerase sigma factor (sigma-70 family)|nr:sigma-70 family RNA polymerase sigma factor [Gemmataceae bacterium]